MLERARHGLGRIRVYGIHWGQVTGAARRQFIGSPVQVLSHARSALVCLRVLCVTTAPLQNDWSLIIRWGKNGRDWLPRSHFFIDHCLPYLSITHSLRLHALEVSHGQISTVCLRTRIQDTLSHLLGALALLIGKEGAAIVANDAGIVPVGGVVDGVVSLSNRNTRRRKAKAKVHHVGILHSSRAAKSIRAWNKGTSVPGRD
ncbi:hypothetical protein IWX49DRAFT_562817 [Phyllosticta citricarpa]